MKRLVKHGSFLQSVVRVNSGDIGIHVAGLEFMQKQSRLGICR